MKTLSKPVALIRAAGVARRWHVNPATVAGLVARGELTPVLNCGRSALFAIADIERIERGSHSLKQGGEYDIAIWPLSSQARTSPVELLRQVEVAILAMPFAGNLSCESHALLRVIDALRIQVLGGEGAHDLAAPVAGPRESFGFNLHDDDVNQEARALVYAALARLLMSMESRLTLRDLGPTMKSTFVEALSRLEVLVRTASR